MVVLLIIVGIVGLVSLFVGWLEWSDSLRRDASWIDFNSFKKFYELNPKRWITHSGAVTCKTSKGLYDVFCFRFIDYHKYRSWLKQQEKIKKKNADTAATKRMMDAVREDIAKHEAESKKMSNSAIDEVINIIHESDWEDAENAILILRQIKELNTRYQNENNH